MNKKILIFIVLLSVMLTTGCQVTRTRKQKTFDPNISDKTRSCQVETCHKLPKKDYYGQFRFSHNKHFATTDAKNCDACHKEKEHDSSLLEDLKVKSYKEFKDSSEEGSIDLGLKIESCRKCHKLEKMSSVHGNWSEKVKQYKPVKETHGKQAKNNIDDCMKCHTSKFCGVCHQVEIPHPKKWIGAHGKTTIERGSDKCIECHGDKKTKEMNFCFTCHAVPMPHPKNIKKTHDTIANQLGIRKCWQCHDEKAFCTKCHKTNMPHSDNFISAHYSQIRTLSPSSCVQCHNNDTSSTGGCFGGDCHTKK